jgi:ABC-type glycerol-3-phosphate transport system substrate-binding protein
MEKLNRRDFLRLSATVGAGAVLAACQPAAPAAPPAAEQPAEKPAEQPAEKPAAAAEQVTVILMDWGGETYPKAWEEVGPQFLEENPGIDVEYQQSPDQWVEKLTAMYVAESPASPDIFAHCCWQAKQFYEAGQVLGLDAYWDTMSADDIADFPTNVIPFWTDIHTGELYSVPKYQGNLQIFVNMEVAKAQGVTDLPTSYGDHWTPERYRDVAMQMTLGEEGTPERQYGAWKYAWSDRNTPFLNSNGGHFVNPDDDTEDWLYKDEALEVLELWRVMRQDDHTMPGPVEVAGETRGRNMFPVQKITTMEEGAWALKEMSTNCTFEWDLVPTYSWPVQTTTLATTDGWSIWKKSTHVDASWELLKFLMSPTYATAIIKAHFLQPSRLSLMDAYLQILREQAPALENVNLELFKEARGEEIGVPMELHYDETTFTEIMKPVFEQVYDLGKAGVDAIAEASMEVTEALRELKARQQG